jgi:hypothetical protein
VAEDEPQPRATESYGGGDRLGGALGINTPSHLKLQGLSVSNSTSTMLKNGMLKNDKVYGESRVGAVPKNPWNLTTTALAKTSPISTLSK